MALGPWFSSTTFTSQHALLPGEFDLLVPGWWAVARQWQSINQSSPLECLSTNHRQSLLVSWCLWQTMNLCISICNCKKYFLFFSSNAFSIMITHQFLDNSISPYGSLTYYCQSCRGIWGIWKDGWSWLVLIHLVGASAEHGHAWWLVMGLVFACGWPELLNERVKGASKTMFLRACRTVGSPGLVSFDSFRFAGFSETASKATTGSPCFHGW